MAEEGIITTRSATATTFKTVTPGPFMLPQGEVEKLWDERDIDLVNREIAGADEATYPPVGVGSRRPVTALVSGDYTVSGTYVSGVHSQRAQLNVNIKHLRVHVTSPVATAPGVITVQLLGVDGFSLGTKDAQIVGPLRPVWHSPISLLVTLDFWFPEGVFDL